MISTKRKHGWLVGALADKGLKQSDLAHEWGVDDAVVSRYISTGKPDLTPERQMILAQILSIDHNELMARLYEGLAPRRVIPRQLRPPTSPTATALAPSGAEAAWAEVRRAADHLQAALPDAAVVLKITYGAR